MSGPTKAEVGNLMQCACCGEDMVINPITNMAHDDELGYVCNECKRYLRVANELLIQNRMEGCMHRPNN